MQLIPLESILVAPNRQRREFEAQALMDLSESIRTHGLMHPPVIRESDAGPVLVAGERRLRAIATLYGLGDTFTHDGAPIPEGMVPCASLGSLDPLAAEEAELEENIRRVDLSWQERAQATARLHALRTAQAAARNTGHTIADTALEVRGRSDGEYHDATRKEIILAAHMDKPEVAKAKSPKEAFKALKQAEQREANARLGASVGATYSADALSVFNEDCLIWLATCPSNSFDVILTDPPYGMGADSFGDAGGSLSGLTHAYDDSLEAWEQLMSRWTVEAFRVAREQAHAYVFCDIDNYPHLRAMMTSAGWTVHRTPIIFNKLTAQRVPWPEHGPRRHWEMCLYAMKGKKPVNTIAPDVVTCAVDANLGMAAQKPVALYTELLRRSCRPGDRVLDTFCGTGPIFPAAHELKLTAVGVEQNVSTYGIALKRIEDLK